MQRRNTLFSPSTDLRFGVNWEGRRGGLAIIVAKGFVHWWWGIHDHCSIVVWDCVVSGFYKSGVGFQSA